MQTTLSEKIPAFVFSSLIASYPDDAFKDNMSALMSDQKLEDCLSVITPENWTKLKGLLELSMQSPKAIDDIRSDYIDIFDRGRHTNPLYETEYARNRTLVKTHDLVDIAGFYKAFGLETGGEGVLAEMIDHIAVELEFYSLLLMKQAHLEESGDSTGAETVLDARKKFLKDHLGRFAPAIVERPGVIENPFYMTVFSGVAELIRAECADLNVVPEIVTWTGAAKEETGEILCGGEACLKE